jgi:hypothetical protein
MKKGIELPFEVADAITLATLKGSRADLKKEIKAFKKGAYLHPDDLHDNTELVKALSLIINYYEVPA